MEAALFYKKKIRQIIEVISPEIVDLEDINSEGLLWKQADVPKVIEKMRREQVDALFFPHCNFGSEGVVGQVAAALNVPVLLYGPRDDAPALDGMRDRDSQCGLFATGKVLRHHNVTFTYITNVAPDDRVFISGYEKFLRVVQVVKTVRNIRILQIGPRPTDFLSVRLTRLTNGIVWSRSLSIDSFRIEIRDGEMLDRGEKKCRRCVHLD